MFYMIVEGDAGERHFGYAHLFRNKTIPEGQFWEEGPTGREMAIYRENEDNYIIINMDPANRYALAALTITRDTITYKGVLYNIQSGVTTDKPLAILGDPVVSRMLSPDNFIQAPDSIQSFNRYSYCANNPLKYTDPSGNSYIETVKDWYSFEGGSFWYGGSHYNYNSENGTFSNNSGHNIGG
ncbi:MAG: hypothetical protein IT219_02740, partial [Bacteroidales bacterium]|nr:hypothetical protein [Bacteroidales bacterium]